MKFFRPYIIVSLLLISATSVAQAQTPATQTAAASAPPAYFIDGYHGGIYGHLPPWQTRFMVDKLKQYPLWKINLELEPESWDTIAIKEAAAYEEFKTMIADQSANGRIEYLNPAYGQSYMYNISGESIIRQLYYGMRKLKQHFPAIVFSTYSSEEPCFTSALPQILRSFGFKYASLKNPNTCWGGYTRAFGGELVDWIGPDGSHLLMVPRYGVEALKPKSTWETIASNNSIAYVESAFKAGIKEPVGMCLQDAGWAYGPWIKYVDGSGDQVNDVTHSYHPTVYETWRGYIENHTNKKPGQSWHFSQEDVLTSLTWGGQTLQKVAREVRAAENKLIATEKLAAMAAIYKGTTYPTSSFDEAWRTLLLSQHHDCWIVPYNIRAGLSWADHVDQWTANTMSRCDSILDRSMSALTTPEKAITVFNTTAVDRDECVEIALPEGWTNATVTDENNKQTTTQSTKPQHLLFRAKVPALGYAVYHLKEAQTEQSNKQNNTYKIETDLYSITIDPQKGGAITRLATKGPNAMVFTDEHSPYYLNELRGNFYKEGGFHSSTETPAQVKFLENGPLRIRVQIDGRIAGTPFTQVITVTNGEPRIDAHLELHWNGDHKIGESPDSIKGSPLKKEFYNDSFKLQALFPVALQNQKIYKNAPFDVLKSKLKNTFFDSWDSIKNVVLLNWVDVEDKEDKQGLAIFSDQTTSYAHGENYPLALTIQFSGPGLFWRDYSITGPTVMDYAILPHAGRWDKAGLWTAQTRWNEPLLTSPGMAARPGSLIHLAKPGWEVSSITVKDHDLNIRLFNAEAADSTQRIDLGFPAKKAYEIALDGHPIKQLPINANGYIELEAPRFGIRTIQIKDVVK